MPLRRIWEEGLPSSWDEAALSAPWFTRAARHKASGPWASRSEDPSDPKYYRTSQATTLLTLSASFPRTDRNQGSQGIRGLRIG